MACEVSAELLVISQCRSRILADGAWDQVAAIHGEGVMWAPIAAPYPLAVTPIFDLVLVDGTALTVRAEAVLGLKPREGMAVFVDETERGHVVPADLAAVSTFGGAGPGRRRPPDAPFNRLAEISRVEERS